MGKTHEQNENVLKIEWRSKEILFNYFTKIITILKPFLWATLPVAALFIKWYCTVGITSKMTYVEVKKLSILISLYTYVCFFLLVLEIKRFIREKMLEWIWDCKLFISTNAISAARAINWQKSSVADPDMDTGFIFKKNNLRWNETIFCILFGGLIGLSIRVRLRNTATSTNFLKMKKNLGANFNIKLD